MDSRLYNFVAVLDHNQLHSSRYHANRITTGVSTSLSSVSCFRNPSFGSESKIIWECNNGGQLWPSNVQYVTTLSTMPAAICNFGIPNLVTAFIISLLVDIAFQVSRVNHFL